MSDAHLATPADNTAPVHLATDAQVADLVSNRFLNDIRMAMTPTKDGFNPFGSYDEAWHDLTDLQGDPQQKVVLDAIAAKIENHDPALGLVQGTVERDKNGDVKSFTFTDQAQENIYAQQLNAIILKGNTQAEAAAAVLYNDMTPEVTQGVVHMDPNKH